MCSGSLAVCVLATLGFSSTSTYATIGSADSMVVWRYSVVVITWDSDNHVPKTQVRALVAPLSKVVFVLL